MSRRRNDLNPECGNEDLATSDFFVCIPLLKLTRRFLSPSPVLVNGQGHLKHRNSSQQNRGREDQRHGIRMASHLHSTNRASSETVQRQDRRKS